jgi:nucleoside-triphosphatase THEP1
MAKIIILSAAIHSGKTTCLQNIVARCKNACGIICPDVAGSRIVIDIESGKQHQLQKPLADLASDIVIGKYVLGADGFLFAHGTLLNAVASGKSLIIVDEIGKLELEGSGLEPAFSVLLASVSKQQKITLLVVIRDYLLQECIVKYNLQQAEVYNIDELIKHFNIV